MATISDANSNLTSSHSATPSPAPSKSHQTPIPNQKRHDATMFFQQRPVFFMPPPQPPIFFPPVHPYYYPGAAPTFLQVPRQSPATRTPPKKSTPLKIVDPTTMRPIDDDDDVDVDDGSPKAEEDPKRAMCRDFLAKVKQTLNRENSGADDVADELAELRAEKELRDQFERLVKVLFPPK